MQESHEKLDLNPGSGTAIYPDTVESVVLWSCGTIGERGHHLRETGERYYGFPIMVQEAWHTVTYEIFFKRKR